METYLVLNLVFLVALAIWWLIVRPPVSARKITTVVLVLLIFTAIFDSLIVGLGIVDYNYEKTLGILIGTAPVEDFFYALLAGILIPGVWTILGKKHERKN